MKLGVCYMVFDGYELLEYAIRAIRPAADFVAITWQTTSYFGNSQPSIQPLIDRLKAEKLLDEAIHYEPDLSLKPKENELRLRNIGLDASIRAGCTHHISLDVDEFVPADQLAKAKESFGDNDYSIAHYECYYKNPQWLITPCQNQCVSFIHPVDVRYVMPKHFPYRIEHTRRLDRTEKCRVYSLEELTMHHMSWVRTDIKKKLFNSMTGKGMEIERFSEEFDKYQLGERLRVPPDYRTRRTKLVPNTFGIKI